MLGRGLNRFAILALFAAACGDSGGGGKGATQDAGSGASCKSTSCLPQNDSGQQNGDGDGDGGTATSSGDGDAPTNGGSNGMPDAGTPVKLPAKGVGQPCTTDTDCESGLTCNVDTVNYVANGQCTASCDPADACETRFGERATCIETNLCVLTCLTDDDCPAKTVCNSDGWCDRTGPGSGNPYCTGVAQSCSLALGAVECSGILGCHDNSSCSGLAESCYDQYGDYSCVAQDGCYWDDSSSYCSGSAHSCDTYPGELSCSDQQGCSWNFECAGTALSCDGLAISECATQPGCTLAND